MNPEFCKAGTEQSTLYTFFFFFLLNPNHNPIREGATYIPVWLMGN